MRVLERVENAGAYADLALRAELGRSALGSLDRALATELVYGTLRWRGRIDHLLSHVLARDLGKLEPRVAIVLRLGAYQLLFSEQIPAITAVDQAVHCARAGGLERATGLVNAVLRRLAAEAGEIPLPTLASDPVGHLTHALSIPGWIAERWIDLFGAGEAAALASASNAVPSHTLRANRTRTRRSLLLRELRERFPDATPCRYAPDGIVLGRRGNPGRDPAFLEGRCTIQDEASQLIVDLLDPRPGERILDVCAAPGTKTTAIAERLGSSGEVLALDRNPRRLALVSRDARRLGLGIVRVQKADATRPLLGVARAGSFDRVLVDPPCSGLGTLRRNPDARWRIRPTDPLRLAAIQRSILEQAAAALRPGGTLVYSTCTLLPEENEAVVEDFLRNRPEFRLGGPEDFSEATRPLADPRGWFRALPQRHEMDGFVAARLERMP
jgi:16S rRNA (cytosine967-C5)-methyltransferase